MARPILETLHHLEHSARALVDNIRTRAGLPFFFGRPFA